MNKCRQTKIKSNFTLIIDDTGHRKSGNFTDGVGRQYIGEIGKTDNGVVLVTTHLYDGVKSLPLDLALYQHSQSLPDGKEDSEFMKKPDLALSLVDRCLERKMKPELVVIDGGYGNNTPFLKALENRKLKYLGGLAKNRKVIVEFEEEEEIRLDKLISRLSDNDFRSVKLELAKPRTVWVATIQVKLSALSGIRTVAIVMNAETLEEATDIDYFITNVKPEIATAEWIVKSYSKRNWVEVFYRDVKGWLGLKEYQVRGKRSLYRHFILVFTAYTFILWHKLTGGLRRRWSNKPLNTFAESLEAFHSAMSFRFMNWLWKNKDVFTAHKESFGYIWA